jgi:hypothetical protein
MTEKRNYKNVEMPHSFAMTLQFLLYNDLSDQPQVKKLHDQK